MICPMPLCPLLWRPPWQCSSGCSRWRILRKCPWLKICTSEILHLLHPRTHLSVLRQSHGHCVGHPAGGHHAVPSIAWVAVRGPSILVRMHATFCPGTFRMAASSSPEDPSKGARTLSPPGTEIGQALDHHGAPPSLVASPERSSWSFFGYIS